MSPNPFTGRGARLAARLVGAMALLPWPVLLVVIGNHLTSPDISRGVVYETVRRLLEGLAIYPAPSGTFVALDYNPLIYFLQAGSAALFGLTAGSLKLVAVLGTLGAGAMIFLIVRRATGSAWFGIVATGLFAAAYRSFDCFLDHPQPDSWMLLTALAGLYLIEDGSRAHDASRLREAARPVRAAFGVALLCLSFWFKQQGALLAIGGVLYLTWKAGPRRAAPYWLIAALLGPVAYFGLGPQMFGAKFTYYTFEVPHAYSHLRLRGILHADWYIGRYWALPAGLAVWGILSRRWRTAPPDIWTLTFPFALMVGLLGAMDFSEHNVYIAPATWFIIVGSITLAKMTRAAADLSPTRRGRAEAVILAAVVLSFAANFYDPRSVMVPRRARGDYDALVTQVRALGGNVYMPGVGQLPGGVRLPVAVQWVALEDLVRGAAHKVGDDPLVREVLKDVLHPAGEAFIIADRPLEKEPLFAFLAAHYELVEDMGDRYASLKPLPGWYSGTTWPRYLYRFRAGGAVSRGSRAPSARS